MIFFHILKVPPLTSIIVFPVGFKTRLMLKLPTSTIDLWRARETSTGDSFFLSSTWQPRRKSSSQKRNPCSHGMKRQARYLNKKYLHYHLPNFISNQCLRCVHIWRFLWVPAFDCDLKWKNTLLSLLTCMAGGPLVWSFPSSRLECRPQSLLGWGCRSGPWQVLWTVRMLTTNPHFWNELLKIVALSKKRSY